jgi:hypothetical protein
MTTNIDKREIEHASVRVATARAGLDHVAAERQRAQDARDEILSRVTTMQSDRQKIIEQRCAGHLATSQEGRLAALVADLEIAGSLLEERERALVRATTVVNEAQSAVARAEAAMVEVEHHLELNGLLGKLRAIEEVYFSGISRAAELRHRGKPGRPDLADLARVYAPRAELVHALRKLELNRVDGKLPS